jgi:hypothetical protein
MVAGAGRAGMPPKARWMQRSKAPSGGSGHIAEH